MAAIYKYFYQPAGEAAFDKNKTSLVENSLRKIEDVAGISFINVTDSLNNVLPPLPNLEFQSTSNFSSREENGCLKLGQHRGDLALSSGKRFEVKVAIKNVEAIAVTKPDLSDNVYNAVTLNELFGSWNIAGDRGKVPGYGLIGQEFEGGLDKTLTGPICNDGKFYPTTPMLKDIQALQATYGANWEHNTDKNTYPFSDPSQISDPPQFYETIWDAGGDDTIDFSATTSPVTINLKNGEFSWIDNPNGTYRVAIAIARTDDPIDNIDTKEINEARNDTIENAKGGSGDDTISGNEVANSLTGNAGNDYLYGELGDDTLDGGDDLDKLYGGAGNDKIWTGAGNDEALGGAGDDSISMADGDDWADGNEGNDTLDGGGDNDKLKGGAGEDSFIGGPGNDTVRGGPGNDTADGGTGNDDLFGEEGTNSLSGGEGNDRLFGGEGPDILDGGDGNDEALGGDGNDLIEMGNGDDWTDGNEGNDTLDGGSGNDKLKGGAGDDSFIGGDGNDTARGGTDNDTAYGGVGNDYLFGEEGNDSLDGGDGLDRLYGGDGLDTIKGGDGNDEALGGDGNDLIEMGNGNDWARGGVGSDTMLGDSGNDTLYGDDGNDDITGGLGSDRIYVGTGNDTVRYLSVDETTKTGGYDVIYDFKPKTGDRIDLSAIDARPDLGESDQAFTLVSPDQPGWGRFWIFDHSWANSTMVQGWIGPSAPATSGNFFQFWIMDGPDIKASHYSADDFIL